MCAKSCRSVVSSAQPSVLALLLQAPATQTAPRGTDAPALNHSWSRRRKICSLSWMTPTLWQQTLGSSFTFTPLGKCFQSASSPGGYFKTAEGACPLENLGAERRGVNPGDHLKGAGAASSLYSEKRSSQRGLQYDAGEPVNREEMWGRKEGGLLGEGVGYS